MTLRVAVTRTAREAEATAARVRAFGAEALVAPLISIAPRAFNTDVSGAQALIFTSTNGVAAFAQSTGVRGLNVLTVGDATAHAAREAGFKAVRSAAGDVEALGALTVETLDPAGGPIVHIAGTHVAGDLAGDLARAGFTYERRVAFDSIAATTLPEALADAVDIVLFHSARAAETYAALGAFDASRRIAGCLSRNVAEAARLSPWKQIVVAPAPREDALLTACLGGQNSPAGASA